MTVIRLQYDKLSVNYNELSADCQFDCQFDFMIEDFLVL